jgi:hypothetical protein
VQDVIEVCLHAVNQQGEHERARRAEGIDDLADGCRGRHLNSGPVSLR